MSAMKKKAPDQSGTLTLREQRAMLCENMNFAAAEAYKHIRTNLVFALPDQEKCRIVGVTSSFRGEGKSTTAINLAYTLAETGKMVLLIDADMRMPTVAKKLASTAKPGLSNVLAGFCTADKACSPSYLIDNWHIMPAGDIPPNPSELLGSEQMGKLMRELSETYDFIVMDLPPVNIVADALVVSQWISGMVLVVRAGYTDKRMLTECMRNLSVLGSKLLGFVVADTAQASKRYGTYKSKYSRYDRYSKYSAYAYGAKKSGIRAETKTVDTVRQTVEQVVKENTQKSE